MSKTDIEKPRVQSFKRNVKLERELHEEWIKTMEFLKRPQNTHTYERFLELKIEQLQKDNRELRLSNLTMLEVNDELRKQVKQFEAIPNLSELQKEKKELREAAKFYRTKLIQHGINIDRKKFKELLNKER